MQLHHGALRVAQARGVVRGDDHGAVGAAGGKREGFADAGGGVDEAEVEMAADLVDKPLHLALARQAHAEAHGRGEQIQVRVERVAHDGLSECRASGDHVGEVHERAVRDPEVEVEIAQADVAVEQQRFFAELRERHAGERRERSFSRAALAGHDGDDLRQGSYLLFVNLMRYSGAFLILAKARG